MRVQRFSAFSNGDTGGNPAGVVLLASLPESAAMQAVAAEVGYSETAFAAAEGEAWRVRYFAPAMEVPFCGHATIALGAALARHAGDGVFHLRLNAAQITLEGRRNSSPPPCNRRRPRASLPRPISLQPASPCSAMHRPTSIRGSRQPLRKPVRGISSSRCATVRGCAP